MGAQDMEKRINEIFDHLTDLRIAVGRLESSFEGAAGKFAHHSERIGKIEQSLTIVERKVWGIAGGLSLLMFIAPMVVDRLFKK